MKILTLGTELIYAYGQTDGQNDMTKLTAAFRSSANAPTNTPLLPTVEPMRRPSLQIISYPQLTATSPADRDVTYTALQLTSAGNS